MLHGKIDILRAELVNRLRVKHAGGQEIFSGSDVERLTQILAGPRHTPARVRRGVAADTRWLCTAPSAASSTPRAPTTARSAVRCSSCDGTGEPTTATYRIGETGDFIPIDIGEVVTNAAALVIRAGGGRAGESFAVDGERMTIGRRPDSDVFLDDVTVSRDHALLVHRGSDWYIDDCGSLNGTYVNRERIDSQRLADGDELQVGKYKLTFRATMSTAAGRRGVRPQAPRVEGPDDRRRLQGAVGRVPRHLDLEDPLPRGSAAADAAAHPGRLPALQRRRRLAPAHDPAPAARRVPAAARDPPGARRPGRPRPPTSRPPPASRAGAGVPNVSVTEANSYFTLEDVLEETKADPKLVAELEDYGVIKGELRNGRRYYDDTEREIIRAVTELARYGVGGRNLRVFRSSADREANLLAADPRPGAALAQPATAQGGGGSAGEPRGGRHAPQAPAAGP